MKLLRACLAVLIASLLGLHNASVAAGANAAFDPVNMASQTAESRIVEAANREAVLRAAISVIQDIKYLIVELNRQAGVVLANPTGFGWGSNSVTPSLSVSVSAITASPHQFEVRIALALPVSWQRAHHASSVEPFTAEFAQSFV